MGEITEIRKLKISIGELSYPKEEWLKGEKYGITVYNNGVSCRMKNARVDIVEHTYPNGMPGYTRVTRQIIDADLQDIDHPYIHFKRVRGKMYETVQYIRAESVEMTTFALNFFLEEAKFVGTWTHSGKTEEE